MGNVLFFMLAILPSSFLVGMENFPKIDQLFNYEASGNNELEKIFNDLAAEFSAVKGDTQGLELLLRNDNKVILRLRDHLRSSKSFEQLKGNMSRVLERIPEGALSQAEIAAASAKLLVAVVGCQDKLDYVIYALSKYEDYVEIFGSKQIAENKALSFFCLFLVCHVLCGNDPRCNLMAAYIQRRVAGGSCDSGIDTMHACQQVLNTMSFLREKFKRRYRFSNDFRINFSRSLRDFAGKIKNGVQIVEDKVLSTWLQNNYGLNNSASIQVLNRLVAHGIIIKQENKYNSISRVKKYVIQPEDSIKKYYECS